MNFFEHQDKARRKTGRLVFLFLLAVVSIVGGTVGIVYGVLYYAGFQYPEFHHLIQTEPLWMPICAAVLFVIIAGSFIRYLQVLGGGVSVAKMVGAQPIGPNPESFEVKRFLNVVDEMAIASGVPVPKLYLLEDDSINAFVAGRKQNDTVMVVTQGALEHLNRQELQAVVGHEFSHIFHSDMLISIRLIGLLGGILAIGQVGYFMMRLSMGGRSRSKKGGSHAAIILIGLGVFIIGYIGLFFGRMIKAAISRERELLADASSVQYTRDPHGLVSAFRTMKMHQSGTHLATSHSEDVNHFCFAPALGIAFKSLLATHPPLDKRIKRIDPQGKYPQLPRDNLTEDNTQAQKTKAQDFLPTMLATAMIYANAQHVKDSIGQPQEEHVDYAQAITTLIPEALRQAARDPEQVTFLLFALILPEGHLEKSQALTGLRDEFAESAIRKIVAMKGMMHAMPQAAYLPLLELALPEFTKLKKEQQIQTYEKLHQVMSGLEGSTFQFALSILLSKRIQGLKELKAEKDIALKQAPKEIMYVLVALLKAGHQEEADQKACFEQVISSLLGQTLPWPKVKHIKFDLLAKALTKVNSLKPLAKEKVVNACIDVVTFDEKVLVPEAELLRAICEILDTPLPPLIANNL